MVRSQSGEVKLTKNVTLIINFGVMEAHNMHDIIIIIIIIILVITIVARKENYHQHMKRMNNIHILMLELISL